MVVTVILTGIPNYVKLTDLASAMEHFLDLDEVGSFQVRELVANQRTYKRRVGLDFESGYEAMAAQNSLDNYHYYISDTNEDYILKARVARLPELPSVPASSLAVPAMVETRRPHGRGSDDIRAYRAAPREATMPDTELDTEFQRKLHAHLEAFKLFIQREKRSMINNENKRRSRFSDSDTDDSRKFRSRTPDRAGSRSMNKQRRRHLSFTTSDKRWRSRSRDRARLDCKRKRSRRSLSSRSSDERRKSRSRRLPYRKDRERSGSKKKQSRLFSTSHKRRRSRSPDSSSSRSNRKRSRRSLEDRRRLRSRDSVSYTNERRKSRSRTLDRPSTRSKKIQRSRLSSTTDECRSSRSPDRSRSGSKRKQIPRRPSICRRRLRSKERIITSSPRRKAIDGRGLHDEVIQIKNKYTSIYDGPSTSRCQGRADFIQESVETELEARREGAALKILVEMETLLQGVNRKFRGKMTQTHKKAILKRLKQIIKGRVAALRANRHLTISQLVAYYRCKYAKADDLDTLQRLMKEEMELPGTLGPDRYGGNVEDRMYPRKSTQDSSEKELSDLDEILRTKCLNSIKPRTYTPSSSAKEPDNPQNITIKIVPKRKNVEVHLRYGRDDDVMTFASDENEYPQKKRARNETENECSIVPFLPGAPVNDPKPQVLVYQGPKTISPNPKFVLPVKFLIREMKALISHKMNDNTFIFLLKRNIRHKIRDLLKGKDYVASKEIKSMYRERYPTDTDKGLVEELERDILAGKYEGVGESGDEMEARPRDGNDQKSIDETTTEKTDIAIEPSVEITGEKLEPTDIRVQVDDVDDIIIQVPKNEVITVSDDSDYEWQEVAVAVNHTTSLSNKNQNNLQQPPVIDPKTNIVDTIVYSECSYLMLLVAHKPEAFQQEYIKIAKKVVEKRVHNLVTSYSHIKFTETLKYYKTLFPKDSNKILSELIRKIVENDVIEIETTEECEIIDGQNGANKLVTTTNECAATEEISLIPDEFKIECVIDEGPSISTLTIVNVDKNVKTITEIASNFEKQPETKAMDCNIKQETVECENVETITEIVSNVEKQTETQAMHIKKETDECENVESITEIASNFNNQPETIVMDCNIKQETVECENVETITEIVFNVEKETETQAMHIKKETDECQNIEPTTEIASYFEKPTETQAMDCNNKETDVFQNVKPKTEIVSDFEKQPETKAIICNIKKETDECENVEPTTEIASNVEKHTETQAMHCNIKKETDECQNVEPTTEIQTET